eukprot:SAG22_NODE_187_length_15860_cov_44.770446_13_plen_106_part_00
MRFCSHRALETWKYNLSEATKTQDIWLVHNCLKLFDALAPGYRAKNDEGDPVGADHPTPDPKVLEGVMVFGESLRKALAILSFCCASTAFLSKTAPFRAVPQQQP